MGIRKTNQSSFRHVRSGFAVSRHVVRKTSSQIDPLVTKEEEQQKPGDSIDHSQFMTKKQDVTSVKIKNLQKKTVYYVAVVPFIRVDGKTIHNIESDIVPFLGAVPQWKTDSSISTDGKEVKIEYTGKGLTIPEQREAYEAIEYPNVFTSAPMLIEDYVPVGKYFAASNLTDREIEALSYEDPLRHQSVRHPRTAVALTEDNHLILIVVDGRRPGFAEGMNAFELTSFIEDQFHPKDAINLDGGGSTALCVKGRGEPSTNVVNYPSKSRTFKHDMERSVPTHIHIIDNQKDK